MDGIEGKEEEQCRKTLSFKAQGGSGGSGWDDGGDYRNIKAIRVYYGDRIDAVQFQYENKRGNSIWSPKHGGNENKYFFEAALNYPSEYLISVHGYHGNIYDESRNPTHVILSLTFETNERSLCPFRASGEGTKFSFPTTGLIKIVGFHGRSGWFLDSIGFHFLPISISE